MGDMDEDCLHGVVAYDFPLGIGFQLAGVRDTINCSNLQSVSWWVPPGEGYWKVNINVAVLVDL